MASTPALLTVPEVAKRLRVSERKVYDFAARKGLRHARAGGKLLFAGTDVDAWLARSARGASAGPAAPTIGGSHDPLLEWAVRESRCGLALLTQGSLDGLARLVAGEVCAALLHVPAPDLADFNRHLADERLRGGNIALVEWARREQGLLVARGNPKRLKSVAQLAGRGVRVALRQEGAGSRELLERLLAREGLNVSSLKSSGAPAMTESDLAAAIQRGEADAGLGVRSAAHLAGLGFVPLVLERLDLAVSRASWFDPPMQRLWAFARSRRFTQHAIALPGYDLAGLGTVTWNDSVS
jgi:excisionase family DNA binding protein